MRDKVALVWPARTGEAAARRPQRPQQCKRRAVLLLYARDCSPLAQLVARLRAILATALDVHDIHSAEVAADSAAAPGDWVRAFLRKPKVACVVVQSPALAALLPRCEPSGEAPPGSPVGVERPLLGSAVRYAQPHFSDCLVQYAWRAIADAALTDPAAYCKYYVCTVTALPTEMVSHVVPYRRYALPAAVHTLLRDVGGVDVDSQGECQELAQLVGQLHDDSLALEEFVSQRPHYLADLFV